MIPLGQSIPETEHAVSVSLPKWQDNIDYEESSPRVVSKMQGGYPRFVFHPLVKKLFSVCLEWFGSDSESCFVLNSRKSAHECRDFIKTGRLVEYIVEDVVLYIILFPAEQFKIAKEFWQHTGTGVSSRFAEHCLIKLNIHFQPIFGKNFKQKSREFTKEIQKLQNRSEVGVWVEERFGRNLGVELVKEAKIALKKRIAGVLGDASLDQQDTPLVSDGSDGSTIGVSDTNTSNTSNSSNNQRCNESHVRLFSCGMSAIYFIHKTITKLKPLKTVQFGFPYLDTLKIQQKFGECLFFGNGGLEDLQSLKIALQEFKIAGLFCEFPSNPLLKSPPLKELWKLANEHDFYLIVDETIGNFVNIHVLEYCDVIVSSLTKVFRFNKVFSGDSNVMGGSIVLNPNSKRYSSLIDIVNEEYQDCVWDQDILFLERNSRRFTSRIHKINKNAESLCDVIRTHPAVKELYYPKYTTPELYNEFGSGGYGGLFSIVLQTKEQARLFFDELGVYKGPSLGTNFTLACPYTLIAHYTELDWAESFGVSPHLIRISVGLEDLDWLLNEFTTTLNKLAS